MAPNEMLKYADVETPSTGSVWRQLSDAERISRVKDVLRAGPEDFKKILLFLAFLSVKRAKEDGQIIVELLELNNEPLPASQRGTLLLDFEEFLKKGIDEGLVVWVEPLGDRNSLRNLRGVEVKS